MTDDLPPFAPEFAPRWPGDIGGYTADQLRAYGDARAAAAVKAKREQCARICDDMTLYTGLDCAEAIRKGE